jgi:hypothetical protein
MSVEKNLLNKKITHSKNSSESPKKVGNSFRTKTKSAMSFIELYTGPRLEVDLEKELEDPANQMFKLEIEKIILMNRDVSNIEKHFEDLNKY